MTSTQQPDPVAVWLSHALVAAAVGALVGRTHGPQAALLAAVAAMAAHHYLDAPVAQHLTALGV